MGEAFGPMDVQQPLDVQYEEPEFWSSVAYYELKKRVGEMFLVKDPYFRVDGFMNPNSNARFCLGQLSQANRCQVVTECRRHIGHGISLWREFNPERGVYVVFVESQLSDGLSIFVQSANYNHINAKDPATIWKVQAGIPMQIFDDGVFADLLDVEQSKGPEAVNKLMRSHPCTVRISFIKGWGHEYRRQAITDTPCWIEVHLHGPLRRLDRVLKQMPGPLASIRTDT